MGASPLYVYMYVAMNNMLVLLYSSRGEKKKKRATQTYFNFKPAKSAGVIDPYTPLNPASRPMSNHPIHSVIHPSIRPLIHLCKPLMPYSSSILKPEEISSQWLSGKH